MNNTRGIKSVLHIEFPQNKGDVTMLDFKVGIIGAGKIAGVVADTLNKLHSFAPYAIASRDINKANEFGDKYNVEKRYGSYEELANDPEVELVYIATPHAFHAEQAKMCIEAGKPVLVEKSFSYDAATTTEVLTLAREKKVFCGEAMWIRFLPMYTAIMEQIKRGVIGNVRNITCSLGYDLRGKERLMDPALAGGALLDLGVYPINLVAMIFGPELVSVSSTCAKLESGVDAQNIIQMTFKGARTANMFSTMMYKPDNGATIYGDKGYIEIDNINNPEAFRIYQGDNKLVMQATPPETQISGYEYEFLAARQAIIVGGLECPEMPHSETIRIMNIMDGLRNGWKVRFPMETEEAPETEAE